MPYRLCLSTCPDPDTARRIARALVEARLAACVNTVPGLESTYRWEGRVVQENECLLLIKTTVAQLDALRQQLLSLHPYSVPEFIVLDVTGGLPDYLDWLARETRPDT